MSVETRKQLPIWWRENMKKYVTVPFQRITETRSCWGALSEISPWWTGMLVHLSLICSGLDPSSGVSVWICMLSRGCRGFSPAWPGALNCFYRCVSVSDRCMWHVYELSREYSCLSPRDCWDGLQPHLTVIRNKEANQSLLNWPSQRTGVSGGNQVTFTHTSRLKELALCYSKDCFITLKS